MIKEPEIQSTSKGQHCTRLIIPKAGKAEMLYHEVHDKKVMFKRPTAVRFQFVKLPFQ